MKKILCTLQIVLFLQFMSAQVDMTSGDWQVDLRYLQETVHKDFPFLFVKTTPTIFDAEVDTLYKNIPNLENHEIIIGFSKIVALFKYGHTGISFRQKPFEFHHLPFNLYEYRDGIYIQGVHKDYQKAIGAKVLEINTIPISDAIERIYPVVNAENDQYFKVFGLNYLRIPEVLHAQGVTDMLELSVELTLEKNGETFKQLFTSLPKGERVPTTYSHVFQDENWLEARSQKNMPLYLKDLDKNYFFEYLPGKKTVYIRQSKVFDDPEENIASFYARVFDFIDSNDVNKLILDVRLNSGGNNQKNKPVITGLIKSDKINTKGGLFVIIGRRTFSACQNLVNEIENYTNATFVGEKTAENKNFYGDSKRVYLPKSKIPVYLSFAWWQDKAPWDKADGTVPAIKVAVSFDEYISNQDPVLDAILKLDN